MLVDSSTFEDIVACGYSAGLSAIGTTSVGAWTQTRSTLERRKSQNLSADMAFTYRNPPRSTEGNRLLRNSRSLLVGAMSYLREDREPPKEGLWGRVGDYAVDEHYERLRTALRTVADELKAAGGRCVVLIDDNALVDREAAWRSGIGWYGKNANILLPDAGSFFVLGSIATDLELPRLSQPVLDGCGTCSRCLPSCPTEAISAPGVIDANKCLSWLLQASGTFPLEFREALGGRIYGCDDCQDVCPPNRVARLRIGTKRTSSAEVASSSVLAKDDGWVPVLDWLTLNDDQLLVAAGSWYVANRDPLIVRRNLLLVLGNQSEPGQPGVNEAIASHLTHPDPVISETARWAANRIEERGVASGLATKMAGGEDGAI